jgi:excisionase family DNA binding protein
MEHLGEYLVHNIKAIIEETIAPMKAAIEELREKQKSQRQEFLSIKDVAEVTGLSEVHVRRAVTGGTLACANVGTHGRPLYRISRRDLNEWFDKRKSGACPPPRCCKKGPPVSRHHSH